MLDIQVLQAPHIASAEDAAMTRMEQQMGSSEAAARKALVELRAALPPNTAAQLDAASAALDRFKTIHKEIIVLSRRNSDVRSLALSLGEKRKVTAECERSAGTRGGARKARVRRDTMEAWITSRQSQSDIRPKVH